MGRINEKKKKKTPPPLPYPGLSSPPSPSEPVQPHPHSLGEHLTLCLIDQPTVVCRSGTVSALFSVALRHLSGAHTARCRGGAAGATGPSTASEWPAQKGGHRSLSGRFTDTQGKKMDRERGERGKRWERARGLKARVKGATLQQRNGTRRKVKQTNNK